MEKEVETRHVMASKCTFQPVVVIQGNRHDCVMDISIAGVLQATEIIHRSKVTQEELPYEGGDLFSVRKISECYLTSRYPPILLNNVGHRLETAMCWFVIQTDKLNSSVQVCLAGSLHDYVTLLQVHNSFLIFTMGFLISCQAYSLFFLFFVEKKIKPWQEHSDTKCSLPCISDSLQCSFFLCVTSQYSKIYTVNDFQ